MSLFTVEKAVCAKDGKCAEVCPVGIIAFDEQGFPVPVEGAQDRCINCGHCVAICPHAALSLGSMPANECPQLPPGWNLSVGQVELLLKGRRSARLFKKNAVDRATIEGMIDIARYAPSGTNRQPVRWMIVYDTEKVQRIAQETISWMKALLEEKSALAESLKFDYLVAGWEKGKDFICRQAPHLVLTYGFSEDMIAAGSCMIAGTYFELAALPYGVGTCWAGYAQMALNRWPAAQEIVHIPKKCTCYGAFLVGYPKYGFCRVPLRNAPKIIWR